MSMTPIRRAWAASATVANKKRTAPRFIIFQTYVAPFRLRLLFRHRADDRQFDFLAVIGFVHQADPKDHKTKRVSHREIAQHGAKDKGEHTGQDVGDDPESGPGDGGQDGLKSMEADDTISIV